MNSILLEDLKKIHKSVKDKGRWKDAIILITGCGGFLGYYFMQYFLRYASELKLSKIIGLDNFILSKPTWLESMEKENNDILELCTFDISKDKLSDIEFADSARYVIHGASIASPSFYRQFPLETIDANIWGLRSLLEFYKNNRNLQGLLFFSSSEIYGDPSKESIPTDEEYRGYVSCHGPRACYDESKRFGETICWVYSKQFSMPITVVRPFNNFGPGMATSDKRLPADFARHVLNNEDLNILSDGSPTRTFCYISDAIVGYLLSLTHGRYDFFNIGMDKPEISVKEFALMFKNIGKKVIDYRGDIYFGKSKDPDYMTDNPNRRCPNISKAKDMLGYDPQVLVEEGVERYLKFLVDSKS